MTSRRWLSVAGALLLTALPILLFAHVWARYAVNVPKWDDHPLKAFLLNLEARTSISDKVYEFFRQHNEHRIVFDRLLTWLDYNLFDQLNYRHLMSMGNASLLGLLVLFGAVLRQSATTRTNWLWLLPPVSLLLFNLSNWENMYWGMAAPQNFGVVLWTLGAVFVLTHTDHPGWGFALGVLATLTSGNGLLVWPVGFLVLLLRQNKLVTKRWQLLGWSIGAVLVIGLYFWGYERPAGNPPAPAGLSAYALGWLAFTGAAAEALPIATPLARCAGLGGLMLALSLLLVGSIGWRWWQNERVRPVESFLVGALAYGLGTGLLVAITRAGFGMDILITSRYKIYSLMLLAVLWVGGIALLRGPLRRVALVAGAGLSLLIAALSYPAYLDDVVWWHRWSLTNQFNWTYTTAQPVSRVDRATARLLSPAPAFYDRCLPDLFAESVDTPTRLDSLYKTPTDYVLEARDAPAPTGSDRGTYALLHSAARTYLYFAEPTARSGWRARLGLSPYFRAGATVRIPVNEPESGTYQVSLLTVGPSGSCRVQPTERLLTVAPRVQTNRPVNW